MKIYNPKSRIVEFTYNEHFACKQGPFDAPSYALNTFFPYRDNTHNFVLRWGMSYTDEATKEPLFIIIVHSQFAFETENVLKDYQDVMKQLNIFYSQVVDFVRDNTEGYFDKLIPKPFVFDDVIDQMKANGYYQHLN